MVKLKQKGSKGKFYMNGTVRELLPEIAGVVSTALNGIKQAKTEMAIVAAVIMRKQIELFLKDFPAELIEFTEANLAIITKDDECGDEEGGTYGAE